MPYCRGHGLGACGQGRRGHRSEQGIGLAVAQELAGEGVLVVAGARSVAPLEGIENVTPFAVDLLDPDGPARLDRDRDGLRPGGLERLAVVAPVL